MLTTSIIIILLAILLIALVILLGPRPRLKPHPPASNVPTDLSMIDLKAWLEEAESAIPRLTPGAEANLKWADPDKPQRTELCLLYIHGFSATPRETAPLTERLATRFGANCVHARLAGHGIQPSMTSTAEGWLQSVIDAWDIAQRIGDRVVVVGTSTGATLSVWLAHQPFTADRIHAAIFLAPNFNVRSTFSSLLTWPWAPYWVSLLVGKYYEWEPQNEMEAKYWTTRYPVHALIEMQKTVDWSRNVDYANFQIPLVTMYMRNDPTIDPHAAVAIHEAWGSEQKQLIPVSLDGDEAQHVFVGDITAPHRVDWCIERLELFLRNLENS